MSHNGFRSDNERLFEHGARFSWLADRASDIHSDLLEALDQYGDCWGHDDIGKSFAATHVDAAEAVIAQLGDLPDQLATVGVNFVNSATAYQHVETTNRTTLNAADHRTGG